MHQMMPCAFLTGPLSAACVFLPQLPAMCTAPCIRCPTFWVVGFMRGWLLLHRRKAERELEAVAADNERLFRQVCCWLLPQLSAGAAKVSAMPRVGCSRCHLPDPLTW